MPDNIFSGIPSLDDVEGLQNFIDQQAIANLNTQTNVPNALEPVAAHGNANQEQNGTAQPQTDSNNSQTTSSEGTENTFGFTSEQIRQIIARNTELENQLKHQNSSNVNANTGYNPYANSNSEYGTPEYNSDQAKIIKTLIDRGVPLSKIQDALNKNRNVASINSNLIDRLKRVEDYLQQQQYAAEEAKFINKMNEFGAKFGLSEKELVTFGNAAMEKGINIANVTDIEAVFRVIYPEQYAIRVQRMSNAPTSQIYGGASTPENPRVSANKLEDAYVEQFMKNSMPNAYYQKKY